MPRWTSSTRPRSKIITVEDPVEYRLPGINQVQVHEKIDLTFARVLRTALRQDPDIILVGEMRDQETAEIGMRAAMTGHLVLSTLHTNDALSTPIRLLDMGVPRYMVALSLQVVLAQRLVRVICENCASRTNPNPHEHEWLRYELRRPRRPVQIRAAGAAARTAPTPATRAAGVYEMLEMNNALVEAANHGDPNEFMRIGREQMAGHTLRRDAVRLVVKAAPRSTKPCASPPSSMSRSANACLPSPTAAATARRSRRWRARGRHGVGDRRHAVRQRRHAGRDQAGAGECLKKKERRPSGFDLFAPKILHVDIMLFTRQMYTLLKAGVPIMRALAGLQESSVNPAMKAVLGQMRESLDSGRELSMSLARHPKVFSPFYLAMVRVGEMTGRLEEIFLRLFDHLEFERFMSEQVKSALRYPSFVILAMVIAMFVVNIFVIPAFAKVFEGFGAELPLMTRILHRLFQLHGRLVACPDRRRHCRRFRLQVLDRHAHGAAICGTSSRCACPLPARSCRKPPWPALRAASRSPRAPACR